MLRSELNQWLRSLTDHSSFSPEWLPCLTPKTHSVFSLLNTMHISSIYIDLQAKHRLLNSSNSLKVFTKKSSGSWYGGNRVCFAACIILGKQTYQDAVWLI